MNENDMIHVTIDRSRWLRGEGGGRSRLRRSSDGMMCCLGFCLLASGKSDDDITDARAPGSTLRAPVGSDDPDYHENIDRPGIGTSLLVTVTRYGDDYTCPESVGEAMHVNDDQSTSDNTKEIRLKDLLALVGYNLTFVDNIETEKGNP